MSEVKSIASSHVVEYRPIEGFPGYRAGNDGTVWSCKKRGGPKQWFLSDEWTLLNWRVEKNGYARVWLRATGCEKSRKVSVHSIVLIAFAGPRPDGMEARHMDGNPLNNHASNLQWATPKENHFDKYRHGTVQQGERNGKSKLNADSVRQIRLLREQGFTFKEIAANFGITDVCVMHVLQGKTWKHVR